MASSPVEEIKEKLDIVDFLRGYLNLQPAGKNFRALCPFHREKTPSFMISRERQSWHCFGCNLGGDLFTFLMHYENVDFGDALKILAEKAGIELRRLSPGEYKFGGLLYEINNLAKEFFKRELESFEPAKQYLTGRGLEKETIEEFEIGFAPNKPEELNLHLLNSGFAPEDILRSGIAFKGERGLQLDRFRGRIMFPIHNHFGKIAGFTGRILPQFDDERSGKYVNSPETPVFNKSKILYGLWRSKNVIRETNSVFLVEGQMDFLMSYQAGVKNAVASSGTALSQDHLRILRRLTENLFLGIDTDDAGWQAGERTIDLAEANDFSVKVVILKGYKDPAEAAQADPEGLREAIKNGKPAPEFYMDKYLAENAGGKRTSLPKVDREYLKNLRSVLGKVKNIASPVLKNYWLKELSKRTSIEEKVLLEEMERIEGAQPVAAPEEEVATARTLPRWEFLSQEILRAASQKSDLAVLIEKAEYLAPLHREAYELLRRGQKESENPQLDEILALIAFSPREIGEVEIETLKAELQKEYVKERRRNLSNLIKAAELDGDQKTLYSALSEFNQLPVL